MTQFRMWIGTLNNPQNHLGEITYKDFIEGWVTKGGAVFAAG